MAAIKQRSKVDKLVATFENFAKAISLVPDAHARKLYEMSSGIQAFISNAREASPRPSSSAIASGLEQGLRELPLLIAGVEKEWRAQVSTALNESLTLEYPEFLERDRERLQKIINRGKIRTEAEFYLVRHHVDLLEGASDEEQLLPRLYSFVDSYESAA